MDVPALRRQLLAWYDRERRELPWRGSRDPWAVLVSEVMLQQTTVSAVIPYFERFVERWPRPADLAARPLDELLELWAGLGYYGRARRLHAAACLVAEGGGAMPADRDGLAALPGVGEYTSAAVASIAYDQPVAAVDGNVERVVTRLAALDADLGRAAGRRALRALAQDWLAPRRPGDWNQALMDLGARVCRPRAPRCEDCPVARHCAGRATGTPERFPVLPARRAPVDVRRLAAVAVRGGRVLLGLRSAPPNEGFLECPGPEVGAEADDRALIEHLDTTHGLHARVIAELPVHRHAITHHRIQVLPRRVVVTRGRVRPPLQWVDPARPPHPLTTATRRILTAACPELFDAAASRSPSP